ncbi:MAG: ABC transporter permease subunit [Clostridia bacterium]|nr:ABC transporter permease subunit [Clostridia bacterium]
MKLNELKKEQKQSKLSPLYKLERKANYKSLIVFSVIISFLLFLTMALFNFVEPLMAELVKMFEGQPEMQELFATQELKIGTYFVSEAGSFWALLAAIYGSFLGYKLINGNLKNGSSEVLYTQNASRTQIVKHKLIRLIINVAILNVVCGLVGLVAMLIWGYGQFSVLNYLGYMLFVLILTMQVAVLSFSIALLVKQKYSSVLSVLVALGLFLIANLGLMGESFEVFNYLTPFAVALADLIESGFGVVNYISIAIWTVIPVVTLIFGIKSYKNTDLV